jgi:radical SAM protein with 4Fe4S-binding SPASM domain
MIDALCRLFTHWALRPNRVPVSPLTSYVRTVYLKMMGQSQGGYDRRAGEWALLVNTDGELYQVMDAYEPRFSLGNVLRDSLDDVLSSDAYAQSLVRDDALYALHCGRCQFRGACNALPLFESAYPGPHPERCYIAQQVLQYRSVREVERLYPAAPPRALQ